MARAFSLIKNIAIKEGYIHHILRGELCTQLTFSGGRAPFDSERNEGYDGYKNGNIKGY